MERPSVAKIGEPGTGKKSPKSHQSSIKLRITVLPQKTKANNKHQVPKSASTINTIQHHLPTYHFSKIFFAAGALALPGDKRNASAASSSAGSQPDSPQLDN